MGMNASPRRAPAEQAGVRLGRGAEVANGDDDVVEGLEHFATIPPVFRSPKKAPELLGYASGDHLVTPAVRVAVEVRGVDDLTAGDRGGERGAGIGVRNRVLRQKLPHPL